MTLGNPTLTSGLKLPTVSRSKRPRSVNAFILPRLGDEEVPTLTAARLRKWLTEIAASPPRLRTRPGQQQNVRDTSDDPEALRHCQPHPDGPESRPQPCLA